MRQRAQLALRLQSAHCEARESRMREPRGGKAERRGGPALDVRQYGLPPVPGLFVLSVNRNGPAYESGVLPGDIIMRIGKERVTSQMHAFALMREYDEGDLMTVRLFREGKEYETEMLLRRKVIE